MGSAGQGLITLNEFFYWLLQPVCMQATHPLFQEEWVASLIADPRVVSLILAWPHTLVEFDNEVFCITYIHSPPYGLR